MPITLRFENREEVVPDSYLLVGLDEMGVEPREGDAVRDDGEVLRTGELFATSLSRKGSRTDAIATSQASVWSVRSREKSAT